MTFPSDQTGHPTHTPAAPIAPPVIAPASIAPPTGTQGAQATMLRASEAAKRLAQQTHTQWVVSEHSSVATLFGVERKS